jgi:predicted short-subunit dehydrogenase-like oxidoreductase (DUF2520 family)
MKDVVIIGSGNLGTHLTRSLKNVGYTISQVCSRNYSSADCLAKLVDAEPVTDLKLMNREASYYFIAVSDSAIGQVAGIMPKVQGIVAHTAGSVSMSVLNRFDNHGVLYPFQTFTRDRDVDFTEVPVLVEGNRGSVRRELMEVASALSDHAQGADSDKREALHMAAVFSSNFVNHLYAISQDLLEGYALDFNLLKPLITETTRKALTMNPADAQTGPARRNDFGVMGHHLEKLEGNSVYAEIYGLMSKSIVNKYHPGSPFFK